MIYFIATPDRSRIKIGTSIRLSQRLKQLASEHGVGLEVLAVTEGSYEAERELHGRFSHLRTVGEWFEPGDDLMGFIVSDGREWDGSDEAPLPPSANCPQVRIDSQVARMAKFVASEEGVSLSDYLTDLLKPMVTKDYRRVVKRIGEEAGE